MGHGAEMNGCGKCLKYLMFTFNLLSLVSCSIFIVFFEQRKIRKWSIKFNLKLKWSRSRLFSYTKSSALSLFPITIRAVPDADLFSFFFGGLTWESKAVTLDLDFPCASGHFLFFKRKFQISFILFHQYVELGFLMRLFR